MAEAPGMPSLPLLTVKTEAKQEAKQEVTDPGPGDPNDGQMAPAVTVGAADEAASLSGPMLTHEGQAPDAKGEEDESPPSSGAEERREAHLRRAARSPPREATEAASPASLEETADQEDQGQED